MRFATLSLAALVAGVLAGCNGSGAGKSSKTKDGYTYTIDAKQNGARKANPGDFITFHATYRTAKDSVLGTSRQQGSPYTMKLDTAAAPGQPKDPFLSCYLVLSQGDTARFEIPTDTLFKGAQPGQRPAFLPPGSNLKMGVKVLRIESPTEQEARIAKEIETIASKGTFQKLENGVMLELTAAGNGKMAQPGDTILVNYTGTLADTLISKKPFDSNINPPQAGRPVEPFRLVLKAGMVIPGWDIAFSSIPEGGKGRILIPHQMGYGAQGAPGAIPPYSNLIFDVELLKVIKGKGLPAAPPMPSMPTQ